MSPPSPEPPLFLLVAGPNGSGKSSAYQDVAIEALSRSVWIINPDLLAARISTVEHLTLPEANLQAVIRIETWLEASIRAYQTVGVETVLSTDKYRRLVVLAKELGFTVWLIYVLLDSPQRNIERVRLRVEKGGHAVAADKIVERYGKSLDQLPWFLDHADRAWLFDNSSVAPELVGEKQNGLIQLDPNALPGFVAAIRTLRAD